MSGPDGFRRFLFEASKTPDGWKALRAYREQKRIVQAASGKFTLLEELLMRHANDRVLIFTADNATVYEVARRYLIPAMTNQTKPKERKAILANFHAGAFNAVVTCQVLNRRRGRAGSGAWASCSAAPAARPRTCSVSAASCASTATSKRCCTR